MKKIENFLFELYDLDIKLWLQEDALRYSAPEDGITSDLLAQLREHKMEIIAFLKDNPFFEDNVLKKRHSQASSTTLLEPIRKLSRENKKFPLSFAQQRLWFLYQLEEKNAVYNLPVAHRIEGPLHYHALEQSLQEIVRRHETLRTTFPTVNGEPIQVVQLISELYPQVLLPIVDLRNLPPEKQKTEVQRLSNEEAQHLFDLVQGPLFRAKLLKLGADTYVFLFNLHHIISDGWSIQIFIRELWNIYEAFLQGKPSPLSPLPIQYVDFSSWQRQWLGGKVLEQQLTYWKQQLADAPTLLELPIDRIRPPLQRFMGKKLSLSISHQLTAQLKKLSQQTGTTLFMILYSAFAILLFRYSRQNDIIIGSPISNRTQKQVESLIGFFVNNLVLRLNLSGNPSFKQIMQQARKVALEAYAHQDIPFERLVDELQPERNLSYSPLFQVAFVLLNVPKSTHDLSDLTINRFKVETGTSMFDLTLTMLEKNSKLEGTFEYSTDLFDTPTINRMAGHFKTLLEGIIANPEQLISNLPLLTDAEQRQLLVEWNNTQTEYPQDQCIHQLFEAQVEKTPDAIALVFEDQQLTYRQLNNKANQLAHYLKTLGVEPEVLVGLCVERSIEMLVGLLGILKAGGAYVPLDPAYPIERLAFMLADSQVRMLLTQQDLVASLPSQAQVVCLDKDWERISQESEANIINTTSPDNLAYVIYTSGSTGKPKGVQIQHRSLTNFLLSLRKTPGLSEQDTLLAITTISFDIAALELYLPLIVGAKIVLVTREVAADGLQLLEKLNQAGITVMQATPATWRLLLSAGWKNSLHLKIFIGGEALPQELAHQLLNKGQTIWNLYGPTETTIWSSVFQVGVQEAVQTKGGLESIGRPIANTQIYLLDQYLQPVPIGVSGELHIGGAGLARGYLNRPELTAEKFIQNPFSDSDARLYKTGDLARYLPDGNIEYLNRIDNQVKLRGFRIELGEIEAVLLQHPEVHEAVVIIREDQPGDKRLVAYLVLTKAQEVMPKTLRQFLKEKLPDYMVPSAFVELEAIPLTPNGKVDRRALPVPDMLGGIEADFVPPHTPAEEILATIWAEILKVEKVGIHDNFFELGGHSLLATQVMSRIRDAFEVELPLRELFESPTIANFSKRIDETSRLNNISILPAIKPISRTEKRLLSFPQQRLWFLDQLEEKRDTHSMSIPLRLTGILNVAALEQCLTEIVCRHENLRTTFQLRNGEAVQVIGSPFPVKLSVVFLQNKSEVEQMAEIQRLATQAHQQPFELALGPLLRFTLLQLGEQSHILLLTMHHIISDGWSIKIFIRELSILHAAFSIGEPSPLPKLPIQYADFAYWQHQWLTGEVLETLLNYWKQQLKEAPPLLELPTDRPRPSIQTYRGAKQVSELSPSLSQGLKTLSRQANVTLFITLLSAFKLLLSRYTGQTNIVVGTPIAGRNRTELENLIGFFINTQVLYTDLSGNPSFHELLSRVREVALGAYAHQELPFEKLVEELQPERNLSYTPLFQVWFNMINLAEPQDEQSGLTVERFSLSEEIPSQFDLTLYVKEKEQAIQLTLVYNVDLFDAPRMVEMLNQFHHLLFQIVAAPDKSIQYYSLVTAESRSLLPEPSAILPEPTYKTVTDLFASWANQTPAQLAVCQGEHSWTYKELAESAHSLAQVLLAQGIKRGEVVAVFGQRSFGMIACMMGIFLSGRVLLTLDQKLPKKRRQLMLQEAKAKLLLSIGNMLAEDEWMRQSWKSIICIAPDTGRAVNGENNLSETKPLPKLVGNDAAYIFFTSGTTGIPKGVLGCHKGMSHFLNWQRQTFAVGPSDRCAQLTGLSFDVLIRDVFLPLVSGATLYIPTGELDNINPAIILPWLEKERISLFHTVPSLAQSWLSNVPQAVSLSALRCLFFAGEPLTGKLISRLRQAFPQTGEIVNFYGPTETTLAKCYYQIPVDIYPGVQPVGTPLPETQALVLNKSNQLCGLGEVGEIVLRTPFRSLGYINAPDENQRKFIKNPFRNDERDLLYYTGDRGRYSMDGTLEIMGRFDSQIKIRGIRIELGEIEVVLAQHPAIAETVVMVQGETDNKYLVAYYTVINQKPDITPSTLRPFIREKLPDYMIPSAFVELEAIPLTPNGKVDRRALPAPEQTQDNQESFVAPQDKLEQQLANLWEKVLHVHPIGRHDNFFELGGHSLLAVTLLAQIEKAFGQGLSMMTIFQAPTIAQFTDILRDQGYKTTWRALQAIQAQGYRPPLFFIGSTNYARAIAPSQGTDQPVYGLNLFGLQPADGTTPSLTVEWIARQYIQDIQTVQPEGPYYLCGYCGDAKVAFEMALQLQAQKQSVAFLAFIDVVWRTSSIQLQNRYVRFWHNLLEFGPSYFFYKIREKIKFFQGRLFLRLSKLEKEKKHYEQIGEALPLQLQHKLLIKSFFKALTHYVPQPYPGGITLFLSYEWRSKDSSALAKLVTEGVEVHEIAGYHRNLFEEPQVSELGGQIKRCLEKTQNAN
ncbi:MAG: amino acid adenylation domain-containing protein [Thiomargarita sp.]|nr:amino acid adenylation domain-containing protein [Thiomargarita sp.]